MTLALDGTAHVSSTTSALPITLSTTNKSDIICIIVTTNGGPVTSVTSPNLTFSRRITNGNNPEPIEFWFASATNALSNETITINTTTSDFITVDAFGVNGANIAAAFDTNGSVPAFSNGSPLSISTNSVNDFIIGASRGASPAVDAGMTTISSADFQAVGFKIVSNAQSGFAVTMSGGSINGVLADAIAQFSILGPQVTTTLTNVPGKHFTKKQYGDLLSEIRDEAIAANQLLEGLSEKDRADLDFDVARAEFEELESSLGPTNYAKAMDAKEKLDKARKARDHHYFMEIVNKEWAKYKNKQ